MVNSRWRWVAAVAASLMLATLFGCGSKDYEVAEVDGVVLVDEQPAPDIDIRFVPNVAGEVSPPSSTGSTDANGHFTLMLRERGAAPRPGAVVGTHRVVLQDMKLAKSATGAGVPIRIPPDYTLAGSTPLTEEIKPGTQTIEIKISSPGKRSR